MGHLLTEILLLLAAAVLAGLGLGWAFFHRVEAPLRVGAPVPAAPPSKPSTAESTLARELDEARRALREAESRGQAAEGRARDALERARLAEASGTRESPASPEPAEVRRLEELEAEVAELKAALSANAEASENVVDSSAWTGLRSELEQALTAQTRLERQVAELEAERDRARQTLAEQEATLDSLSHELAGRPRTSAPATKVVSGASATSAGALPASPRPRTPTLSAMRAVAPGRGGPAVPEGGSEADSSPRISVRPAAGRTATLAEGSPSRSPEHPRPATVRQARIDASQAPRGASSSDAAEAAPDFPAPVPAASPEGPPSMPRVTPRPAASGVPSRAEAEEVTVAVSLGDLVGRIDASEELPRAEREEATGSLDILALVGRIDATTDADTDAAPDDGPEAPPPLPEPPGGWADASATIQQPRPSFLDGEDLKILKGVGPATEVRMREFGVTSWRALADLDEDTLPRFAEHMKLSVDRVRQWIGQARALTLDLPSPSGLAAPGVASLSDREVPANPAPAPLASVSRGASDPGDAPAAMP